MKSRLFVSYIQSLKSFNCFFKASLYVSRKVREGTHDDVISPFLNDSFKKREPLNTSLSLPALLLGCKAGREHMTKKCLLFPVPCTTYLPAGSEESAVQIGLLSQRSFL